MKTYEKPEREVRPEPKADVKSPREVKTAPAPEKKSFWARVVSFFRGETK